MSARREGHSSPLPGSPGERAPGRCVPELSSDRAGPRWVRYHRGYCWARDLFVYATAAVLVPGELGDSPPCQVAALGAVTVAVVAAVLADLSATGAAAARWQARR